MGGEDGRAAADADAAPCVSVLMAVHNGASFLRECLDSLVAQTVTDWEIVVVDDGSTDGTPDILAEYAADFPIRVTTSSARHGAAASLNLGLPQCRGEFVARMDADDIAVPERFAWQVAFMRQNPGIDVCSSGHMEFGAGPENYHAPPPDPPVDFMRGWTLSHPTMMFRRERWLASGLRYDPRWAYAEDYDLCTRMAGVLTIGTIDAPLVRYRRHPSQTSTLNWFPQEREALVIQRRYISRCLRDGSVPRSDAVLAILRLGRRHARYLRRRVVSGERARSSA